MFVLIHSPLVGPITWAPVAFELRQKGIDVLVPELPRDIQSNRPYWEQHAGAIARALRPVAPDQSLILIGHSGAGLLLPAIREITGRSVTGYVFADAGIPEDGKSRFDLMWREEPEIAAQRRQSLAAGERFPNWTDADLRDVIPNAELRQGVLADLRPQPPAFFAEPIPVFAGWPDAPCAYLKFNPVYAAPAERARKAGWAYAEIDAGHFHMLVDPNAVANALVNLSKRMGLAV